MDSFNNILDGDADLLGFVTEPVAHARRDDMDTSHEAAADITPRIRELQKHVLEFAAECAPGFTDVAMNEHFGTSSSTYRTRRAELVEKGLIEDTGERVTFGGSGRRHAVWRITDRGRAACQS